MWRELDSSYADGRLVVLEVPTCNVLRDFYMAYKVSVSGIAFSPDNRYVAVDRRNRISVYDLQSDSDRPSIDIRYKALDGVSGYSGQYVAVSVKTAQKLYLKARPHL